MSLSFRPAVRAWNLGSLGLLVGGLALLLPAFFAIIAQGQTDGVTVSVPSLTLTELGDSDSVSKEYTIVLATDPGADVTITVSSGDSSAVAVDTDSTMSGDQNTLVFTHGNTGNWGTAQTVTVRAVHDGDTVGEQDVAITHTASASSGPYNGIMVASVEVDVTDAGHGVYFSPTSLSVKAGATVTYDTFLKSQPSGNVPVNYASEGTAVATGSGSFTFGTTDWNIPQTATITGVAAGTAIIGHSINSTGDMTNYPTSLDIDSVSVTVTVPAIFVSRNTPITEGGSAQFHLNTSNSYGAPGSPITVNYTVTQSGGVIASGATGSKTFSMDSASPSLPGIPTIDDNVDEAAGSVTVTINPGTGYTVGSPSSATVVVNDNDTAGVTISKSTISVDENGGKVSYTVGLDTEPGGSVTVTVTSSDTTVAGVSTTSTGDPAERVFLVFGPGNLSVDKMVYVVGVNDDVINTSARTATISHAVTGAHTASGYTTALTIDSIAVTLVDDDMVGATVSKSAVTVAENGGTATYTMALDYVPAGDVTVTVTGAAGVEVSNDGSSFGATTTLLFTVGGTTNKWDNPHTVTVRGQNDDVDNAGDERSATITHAVTSGDGGNYDSNVDIANVVATVTDDDTAGVTISESTVTVSEDGTTTTDTYTVKLDTKPRDNVTIRATSATGAQVDGPAVGRTWGATTDLTFTPTNWNTAQTVTVRGQDDDIDNASDRSVTISHAITDAGADGYPTNLSIDSVTATITDDDTAGITLSESTVTVREDGTDTDTYTVKLASKPRDNVTIRATSATGAQVDGPADGRTWGATTDLTFTPTNWNSTQTVTVRGQDDDIDNVGDKRSVTISHTVTEAGADGYPTSLTLNSVTADVTDDDAAGVTLSTNTVTAAENEGTATYTLVLTSEPLTNVTINVGAGDANVARVRRDGGTFSGSTQILFTPSNWNSTQTVTVQGKNDDIDNTGDSRSTTITHTIASSGDGGRYTNTHLTSIGSVTANVTDDDTAGVTISKSTLTVKEDGTDPGTYTVVLDSEPTDTVTVALASGTSTAARLDSVDTAMAFTASETLSFSQATWDTPKTVRVQGVNDNVDNPDDSRSSTISHTIDSTDPKYSALADTQTVAVTVSDDDARPTSISLSLSETTLTESAGSTSVTVTATVGGTTTFGTAETVNVSVSAPTTPGTVGITSISDFTISIPAGQRSASVTKTVSPTSNTIDDADATVTFSGELDGEATFTVNSATLSVTDDDATPTDIHLSNSRSTNGEDDNSQTIIVTARVQGTTTFGEAKTVTVSVAGSGTPGSVGFAAVQDFTITIPLGSNSATGQFTLNPTEDNRDELDETVTISGTTPNLGRYDSGDGSVTVSSTSLTITDADAAPTGVTLTVNPASISDGTNSHTVTVTATVGGSTRYALATQVSVSFAGSGGTNVVPFTDPGTTTITIPAGGQSATGSVTLMVPSNSVDHYDETITVSGTAGNDVHGNTVSVTSATLPLTDTDDTTVTMSASTNSVSENNGTADVTLTLSRALIDDESITVPLKVLGATVTDNYTIALHPAAQTGVTLLTSGTHSTQNPALQIAAGASAATLRFTAVDNEVRTQPWVSISYGTGAAGTNIDFATPTAGEFGAGFVIADNETGDILVPPGWSLKPTASGSTQTFRLVFTTSGTRDASSSDIADYDAFIRNHLVEGNAAIVPYAGFFKAIGSTSSTVASSHNSFTGSGNNIPVYWLGGRASNDLVASNYSSFRGEWQNQNRPRNEQGTLVSVSANGYLTGSNSDGTRSSNPLGADPSSLGFLNNNQTGRAPLGSTQTVGGSNARSFYGMSPVFKVADVPTITIAAANASVTEGTAASFTLTADMAITGSLTVKLLVAENEFVSPENRGQKQVTFSSGSSTATFSVPTNADSLDFADEGLRVAVLSGSGYAPGDHSLATVVVKDNDPTSITLALGTGLDPPNISEGESKPLTLTLGRNLAQGESVTVPLTFSGTATRGTDYTLACSGVGITCSNLNSGSATVSFGTNGRVATLTLTAEIDSVASEMETVNIGLGTVTHMGLSGGISTPVDSAGAITIVNVAPASVTASFASTTYTAGEASGSRTANVVVNLSPAPTTAITLSYTVSGTATSGTDFSPLTDVEVTAGSSTATIPVTILDDTRDDDGETIVLTLVTSTLYNLGTNTSTTVTITDDDATPTSIALSTNPPSIMESAGTVAVTVTATVQGAVSFDTPQSLTVTAARTSGGVGVAAIPTFTITIPAGSLSGSNTVAVTPQNDSVDEADATVTFSGVLASVTVSTASVGVSDDDATPSTVSLSLDPVSVTEGAGATTVTVTATVEGSTTFGTAKTVQVTATRSNPLRVNPISNFTITIPAGTESATHDVNVTAIDNNNDEPNANVKFAGTLGGATVNPATLTVVDDDGTPSAVSLSVSPVSVTENAGATTVTVTAMVDGSTTFATDQTVQVSVAGSGKTGVVGFSVAPASFGITIPGGQTSSTGMFSVTPTDDTNYQKEETLTVSGVLTGVNVSSAQLKLVDDLPEPPSVSFSSASSTASEGGTGHTVTVTLSNPAPSGGLTLRYTLGGDAVLGADYMLDGTVSVTAGATTASIQVPVIDDAIVEDFEKIVLTLKRGPLSGYTLGSRVEHTVVLVDNEAAPLAYVVPGSAFIPTGLVTGDRFRLLFVTSTKTQALSTEIAVYNTFVQNRAAASTISSLVPYSSLFRAVVSTPRIDAVDNTKTATRVGTGVPIYWVSGEKVADHKDDFYDGSWASRNARNESGGTATVTSNLPTLDHGIWTGSTSGGSGWPGQELGTANPIAATPGNSGPTSHPLNYNEGTRYRQQDMYLYALSPVFEIRGPELTVTGNRAEVEGRPLEFTIRSDATVGTPFDVSYTVRESSTSLPGSERGDKTASFSGDSLTINIPTLDGVSTTTEHPTATVALMTQSSYRVGSQGSATVSVIDNDGGSGTPALSIIPITRTVAEGEDAGFRVYIPLSTPSTMQTVSYTVAQDGNVLAADQIGNQTASFTGNTGNFDLTIPTLQDLVNGEGGSVTVTINSGMGYVVAMPNSARVYVTDDDEPPSSVKLSVSPTTISESAATTTVTVTATPQGTVFGEEQTIMVTPSGPNNPDTVGFTPVSTFVLTIPAGASSGTGTFDLTPVNDNVENKPQVIVVSGSLAGVPVEAAQLSLTNDDNPPNSPVAAFASASSNAGEGAGSHNVTINFTPKLPHTITLLYSVTGTATPGSDYTNLSGSVTANANASSATISVPLIDDSVIDPGETVILTLDPGTGYNLGSQRTHQITINDNDSSTTPELTISGGSAVTGYNLRRQQRQLHHQRHPRTHRPNHRPLHRHPNRPIPHQQPNRHQNHHPQRRHPHLHHPHPSRHHRRTQRNRHRNPQQRNRLHPRNTQHSHRHHQRRRRSATQHPPTDYKRRVGSHRRQLRFFHHQRQPRTHRPNHRPLHRHPNRPIPHQQPNRHQNHHPQRRHPHLHHPHPSRHHRRTQRNRHRNPQQRNRLHPRNTQHSHRHHQG